MGADAGARPTDMSLYERLEREPRAMHIFLALRILEAEFREAPRHGEARRPDEEPVRLGQEPDVAFARTTVLDYAAPEDDAPGRMTNLFFGVFGPNGPLPLHLTEYARERKRTHRDPTLVAFADMLTQRFFTLLYKAWRSGQPTASFDRGPGGPLEQQVAAFSGLAGPAFRRRDALPDVAKRHFAGHLGPGPRHPQGLVAIVSAFFRAPVSVQEFVGSWLAVEEGDRWRLGSGALGQTMLGARAWSRQAKLRLRIGPLSMAQYVALLPGGTAGRRLVAILRGYLGDEFDWDVNLVLRADDVPAAMLGADTRLGQTAWVGGRPQGGDADDLFLSREALDTPSKGRPT